MTTKETNEALNELMAQVAAVIPESPQFSAFSFKCAIEPIVNRAVAAAVAVQVDLVDKMTEALLLSEWHRDRDDELSCSCCDDVCPSHDDKCETDAALAAAGFPDQASRDAERARRAGR
jgi:hypothetical protein